METVDTKEITTKNDSMKTKAQDMVIKDDETLEAAGTFLKGIKTLGKYITAKFEKSKKAAKAAHTEICDLEKDCLTPGIEAEVIIKKKLGTYVSEQEEAEKKRAAKLAAELKTKAEADALALAEDLEKNGMKAEADLALEVAAAPVVVAPVKAVKVAGVSFREAWEHKVIDPDNVPDEFWIIDEQKLASYAKAMKEQAKVEGVVFSSKKIVAARA